ncbi:MAG: 4Fe-4S binding protein [Syntrophomonadaceae bacterium]|jgi:uncharacterized pyridoxamine 5'-phosphate oxidase family protein/Pyruvate/2-oxoacid:ferredoxin oxidoreductase delta subunit|nr:4Fe-4S binding protein [Syntrophomonadaceae bacterium]
MDAKTCIQKLRLIASVTMATVGEDGSPQARIIGVMHTEDEKLYFLTARGKPFYHELLSEKKVAVLGLSRFKEMIRLNGAPELLPKEEQGKWLSLLFEENPYMANVYPGETREVLEVFCIRHGEIEYFHLGVRPIVRESYTIGNGVLCEKLLYTITDDCNGCGICMRHCPQSCIKIGVPYSVEQAHCLRCGACMENCPVAAVKYRKE